MLNGSHKLPSAVYVFVVMSLAAFLVMFTVSHRPKTQFIAQVRVPLPANASSRSDLDEVREALLAPSAVLEALQRTKMVDGEATSEMLTIAAEIADRMSVETTPVNAGQRYAKLSLLTEHPAVAVKLLDQIRIDFLELSSATTVTAPAIAKRVYGNAISPRNLLLISMCSALVGLGGLVWLEDTNAAPVLLTKDEVAHASQLPVVVDFTSNHAFPARAKHQARRRRFEVALRCAEFSIAAVVLLIVFNVATVQAFSDLVARDPLSAYSEAIGRLLG